MKKFVKYCFIALMLSVSLHAQGKEEITGKILETLESGGYTYLKLDSNGEKFWTAVRQTNVKVGETVSIKEQVWMTSFKSTTLDRTFDRILFAELITSKNIAKNKQISWADVLNSKPVAPNKEEMKFIKVEDSKNKTKVSSINEETVSYIVSNKDKLKDRTVKVTGEVTKIMRGIMNTSWVHVLDKNGDDIIFRAEKDELNVGDKVKAEGILNVDVDYGYGYSYETIVIKATFQKL